jgi:2-hydroxy-3-oxopropionate reductase
VAITQRVTTKEVAGVGNQREQHGGFIGLGVMGQPMATNLVRAGFDVVGYNRSQSAVDRLVANGGRAAGCVGEDVHGAGLVITMLPDTPDVELVMLGSGGVLECAEKGTAVVDMSTIRPEASRAIANVGLGAGQRILDAPVSGGERGAIDGKLSIMIGGGAGDVEAVRSVLEVLGSVCHVGPNGAGQIVKAANQLLVAGTIGLVAESLVFLEAHGVDVDAALLALGSGLAGSSVLERKPQAMRARSFAPGFRSALHHKDLGIVLDAAREAGIVLPMGALVSQLFASLVARGDGEQDHAIVFSLIETLSGRAQ